MLRFVVRHFTAILIIAAIGAWALFYLPNTPSWTILRLKHAIDDRDGPEAARFVDFNSVVQKAGYEAVQKQGGNDPLTSLVGKAAIDLLSGPMAGMLQQWGVQQVNDGNQDLQMPAGAAAAAIITLHRNGDTAWTDFKDQHRGEIYEIYFTRRNDGLWQVSEVKNVGQLLERLKSSRQKNFPVPGLHGSP